MDTIRINGLAKLEVTSKYGRDGEFEYGRVELNGEELESIIARTILGQNNNTSEETKRLTKLVDVNITIDPDVNCLSVNGDELPLKK